MCVILCFEDEFPKLSMLEDAETTNPHGGGMSWINKEGKVEWMKGQCMKPKKIMKMIKQGKMNLPIIIHYRIATHGAINDMMCHPFPLGKKAHNAEHGVTEEGVMFHNGIWNEYNEYAIKLCMTRNVRIPDGDMSDSSIMAWIASHVGHNFLHFTEEKVITMTPAGITRYGDGWVDVQGIKCSNDNFEPTPSFGYDGYDTFYTPTNYHRKGRNKTVKAQDMDLEAEEGESAQSTLDGEEIPLTLSNYEDEYYERQAQIYARKKEHEEDMKFYNNCEMEDIDGEDMF
jgi:hypothetical protein